MKNNMKYIITVFFIVFLSCGEGGKTHEIDKCLNIVCNQEQTCKEGLCVCDDTDKKVSAGGLCICKDDNKITDESGKCVDDTIAPVITEVKGIENGNSFTENVTPEYTFNSDEVGELHLKGDCRINDKPVIKKGENTIKFDELYSGLYENCEIWITDRANNESNHLKLKSFSVFNVKSTETIKGRTDGIGVDYVIIGDGFKEDELDLFKQKAQEFSDYILNYDPVLTAQSKLWNIHLINLVSKESGADNSDDSNTPELVNTGLDAYFNCNNIQRLLCINQSKVNYIVGKHFPQFDKVLVIVNSKSYGGAGGNYATASINPYGKQIAIHELGHSFAGLADEYEYGRTNAPATEPAEPNITINNDPQTVKWKKWLPEDNIDIFEGGGYVEHGVYRPTEDSLMRTLGKPLYQVNLEAWTLALYHIVGGYITKTPEKDDLILWGGTDYDFSIELSLGTNMQRVEWYVDGVKQEGISDDTTLFTYGKQTVSKYQVKAVIYDKSDIIRNDPFGDSVTEAVWNITPE